MIVPVHDNCDCCMCLSMKHLAMYSDLIEVPAMRRIYDNDFVNQHFRLEDEIHLHALGVRL